MGLRCVGVKVSVELANGVPLCCRTSSCSVEPCECAVALKWLVERAAVVDKGVVRAARAQAASGMRARVGEGIREKVMADASLFLQRDECGRRWLEVKVESPARTEGEEEEDVTDPLSSLARECKRLVRRRKTPVLMLLMQCQSEAACISMRAAVAGERGFKGACVGLTGGQ